MVTNNRNGGQTKKNMKNTKQRKTHSATALWAKSRVECSLHVEFD